MVFSWWQRWSEGELLPYWQHFQKVSKTAKQCNITHNMNSNNTTRTIWHNNWSSELKSSGSTQPEEPLKDLRALEGLKGPAGGKALGVWWPGVCKDCRLVVLGLGSRPRAAADVGGPLLGPYNSDQALPHQGRSSFVSSEGLPFKGPEFLLFWNVGWRLISLKYWPDTRQEYKVL